MNNGLSIGQSATLACSWEASAPKPGNVHRGADFEDLGFDDFLASAVAIGPAMESAHKNSLGRTVLMAVEATRNLVGSNTNLGTILLLAPLCKVPREQALAAGVRNVLARLTSEDAGDVYQAIRIARPGGLGRAANMDVADPPPTDLLAAMRAAADADLVARQYAENFEQLFGSVVPWMTASLASGQPLAEMLVQVHLQVMSSFPDSLIARKCGPAVAEEAARRAERALAARETGEEEYFAAIADLDFWLRSDGHRRNPGTSADMIAAGLFSLLRDGIIKGPRISAGVD